MTTENENDVLVSESKHGLRTSLTNKPVGLGVGDLGRHRVGVRPNTTIPGEELPARELGELDARLIFAQSL